MARLSQDFHEFGFFYLLKDKVTVIFFLFELNLKLEKFHLSLSFILLPASYLSLLPISLGSDHVHLYIELLMETTSTQKKKKLMRDCMNNEKEISFTFILFLCVWQVI